MTEDLSVRQPGSTGDGAALGEQPTPVDGAATERPQAAERPSGPTESTTGNAVDTGAAAETSASKDANSSDTAEPTGEEPGTAQPISENEAATGESTGGEDAASAESAAESAGESTGEEKAATGESTGGEDAGEAADVASTGTAGADPTNAGSGETAEAGGRFAVTEETWDQYGPPPERAIGRFERAARRAGRFFIHEWTLACLGSLALAVVMFWPSVRHPSTTIPADIWDPTLQAWQLAWAGHALLTDPMHLWNGNAFYPDTYSFAFSDTDFGYFPFALVGSGPSAALVRYNIVFVLLHAMAFLGPYALVRQLGSSRIGACVAAAAFAYAPWRWAQAGHMHVLSDGGIALALAMLARGHGYSFTKGFQRDRTRPGWAFAGWCAAAWQVSIGFGIGLPFLYVLAGICVAAIIWWFVRHRPALGRRTHLANLSGVIVLGVVSLFMGLPYLQVTKLHPEAEAQRGIGAIQLFSPTLRDFLAAPAQSRPWGTAYEAARDAMVAPAETTLLPGFILIGLAVAGLIFSVWPARVRIYLAVGTALSVILGMGTTFPGGGKFTYLVLYHHLPFFNASRTPGRLVVWTTLLLAVLAAGAVGALSRRESDVAADRVTSRPGWAVRLAMLIPLALVLAEGTNKVDHPVVPTQPAAMRTVDGPMMVLPSDSLTDENVMIWSTTKFQKMVNGGSGFGPTDQSAARTAMHSFPDQGSVAYLRRIGVRAVIVLKDRIAGNTDYPHAGTTDPVDDLGITRQDDGDTVIYTIN